MQAILDKDQEYLIRNMLVELRLTLASQPHHDLAVDHYCHPSTFASMPKLDEISYSRDTCVKAIRDYYRFLTQMYLPGTEIIEPPEGGWPTITNETLQDLGKTPEVVALLRELPYIRSRDDRRLESQVAPHCYFADWQDLGHDLFYRLDGRRGRQNSH